MFQPGWIKQMKTRKTIEHVNLKQHIPLIVVFKIFL